MAPDSNGGKEPERNGSTIDRPGYENCVPCLSMQCMVCGWHRWGHFQDDLDAAYAVHLNDERHSAAAQAQLEREERVETYRLANLAMRELA